MATPPVLLAHHRQARLALLVRHSPPPKRRVVDEQPEPSRPTAGGKGMRRYRAQVARHQTMILTVPMNGVKHAITTPDGESVKATTWVLFQDDRSIGRIHQTNRKDWYVEWYSTPGNRQRQEMTLLKHNVAVLGVDRAIDLALTLSLNPKGR